MITEVRLLDGRFMASEPHYLDQGPEPSALYDLDLTPWLESPSVHELVGLHPEVRQEPGAVTTIDRHSRRSWSRTSSATGSSWSPACCRPTNAAGTGRRWTRRSPAEAGDDTRALAEKSRYEQSFIQCQNLWEDSADVRPLTSIPLLAETAARLLGVDAVRLWHDQALYKEPGGRETDPHQDQPYWPIVETNTITAWIPFDGSTLESGAMGYLPGSHRLGLREFVNIFTGDGRR